MSIKRRRPIPKWTTEHIATENFECDQCEHDISSGSVYVRRVFTVEGLRSIYTKRKSGDTLEVERTHAVPGCWQWQSWHQ